MKSLSSGELFDCIMDIIHRLYVTKSGTYRNYSDWYQLRGCLNQHWSSPLRPDVHIWPSFFFSFHSHELGVILITYRVWAWHGSASRVLQKQYHSSGISILKHYLQILLYTFNTRLEICSCTSVDKLAIELTSARLLTVRVWIIVRGYSPKPILQLPLFRSAGPDAYRMWLADC